MIIGIVRHGQTDYNKRRLIQGYTDNPLNETGYAQATSLGNFLKTHDTHWDYLIVSPLIRAIQSAQTIGKEINLDISHTDKRFIERDFGPFEGMSIDDVFPRIAEDGFSAPNYESNDMIKKRVTDAIFDLYKDHKDKKILIVAHSHVVKSLLVAALPEVYNFHNYYVLNSSIFYFDVSKEAIKLINQYDI
mgnify:CR=1 FL=1